MRKRIIAALGAVSAIALFATACSTDNTGNGGTKVEKSSSSKKSEVKYYKLGETVKVGDVEYTLKSVEKTDERNEFEDSKPANVIKVVYHVKNDGKEDLPIGTDLDAYGPENNKLKSYPISNTTVDSIAPGKESDVTTGFGTDKLGDFELQFRPLASFDKSAKFKVNVQ
ncbi:MAG: DUF4352 domain-containing protein [Lactobacillus johnsonii]|nr:DUF4352 domain-containing protein [Lactobacillus johnsonii]MDY2874311.1 DUF4352 domain-containing protein [Lactobacillus johnsonii]